jgi:hypothetical protein
MTSAKSWILLSQQFSKHRNIQEDDILGVLPDEIRRGDRQRVRIENDSPHADLSQVDWNALQREQAARVDESRLLDLRAREQGIVYFGMTPLPLAMDLGFRTEKWVHSRIFQYQDSTKTWHWPGRAAEEAGLEVFTEDNLLPRPSAASGDIVVRVSVNTRIAEADTLAVVPAPAGEIHIHLGEQCSNHALRTPEDVERVAVAFRDALDQIHVRHPQARMVHVFLAGPVSLAFRMGCLINHTRHPCIQTYQFILNASPRYRRALILGQRVEAARKIKILFLSADPKHLPADLSRPRPERLRIDEELRAIWDALRRGDHRDEFDELPEPRAAVRTTDIGTHLRRSDAEILHFSGHGDSGGKLILESASGSGARRVDPEAMRRLFERWNKDGHIRCAVFNACLSNGLAKILVRAPAVVPCAVGTLDRVSDEAALAFSTGFYGALANGESLQESFDIGVDEVALEAPGEHKLFQLSVADESLRDLPIFAPRDRKA